MYTTWTFLVSNFDLVAMKFSSYPCLFSRLVCNSGCLTSLCMRRNACTHVFPSPSKPLQVSETDKGGNLYCKNSTFA
ncbi:hypothetical protein BABINDRAFT_118753 [Babjeviella inositovora NRRL Y-12698]|uniref:Uncharacterized protein n=1 Tax=Babjeviella inositovora NRRL Y-12698 TaxID=984486 RepID=A0A1E3QTE6_9ASCO|nr:uncharacterized protein BABINDRAFT_118753 [Babjeviella inositovora NRRL Y-12698]ODQ80983.1 hypothetical protein BABINDRAFT_118753 [Babjeviella inositovora NRRL Y-12698]